MPNVFEGMLRVVGVAQGLLTDDGAWMLSHTLTLATEGEDRGIRMDPAEKDTSS